MEKKVERVLEIYSCLMQGEVINKNNMAMQYGVNKRTIQRDIDDIRAYFSNKLHHHNIIYDHKKKGYVLVEDSNKNLTNSEIFAVCKILLESRSMVKEEMIPIIDKLIKCCVPYENLQKISELIGNEKFHYLEPHHGKQFLNKMWEICDAVHEQKLIKIKYKRLKDVDQVMRMVQPVGIMFSEYYFYLCAYICKSEEMPHVVKRSFPTIYRIDRIYEYEILDEHFDIPYRDRFEEGEFRKRIQFMFGGELKNIKFKYKGISIESILDRFPTAKILNHDENGWIISAEVYGEGANMWLRSQGPYVEIIK